MAECMWIQKLGPDMTYIAAFLPFFSCVGQALLWTSYFHIADLQSLLLFYSMFLTVEGVRKLEGEKVFVRWRGIESQIRRSSPCFTTMPQLTISPQLEADILKMPVYAVFESVLFKFPVRRKLSMPLTEGLPNYKLASCMFLSAEKTWFGTLSKINIKHLSQSQR